MDSLFWVRFLPYSMCSGNSVSGCSVLFRLIQAPCWCRIIVLWSVLYSFWCIRVGITPFHALVICVEMTPERSCSLAAELFGLARYVDISAGVS